MIRRAGQAAGGPLSSNVRPHMRLWLGTLMALLATAMVVAYAMALRGYELLESHPSLFFVLFAAAFFGPSLRSMLLPPPSGSNVIARQLSVVSRLPRWALVLLVAVFASCVLAIGLASSPLRKATLPPAVFFLFFFVEATLLLVPQAAGSFHPGHS